MNFFNALIVMDKYALQIYEFFCDTELSECKINEA